MCFVAIFEHLLCVSLEYYRVITTSHSPSTILNEGRLFHDPAWGKLLRRPLRLPPRSSKFVFAICFVFLLQLAHILCFPQYCKLTLSRQLKQTVRTSFRVYVILLWFRCIQNWFLTSLNVCFLRKVGKKLLSLKKDKKLGHQSYFEGLPTVEYFFPSGEIQFLIIYKVSFNISGTYSRFQKNMVQIFLNKKKYYLH